MNDPFSESSLTSFMPAVFAQWWMTLLILCVPFVLFAAMIHVLERLIQKNLAERFGWKSVMWTGWLGTPIHELSHLLMCLVFRHRIEGVAFFEPDLEQGRLGYVHHSWRRGNWFEELGHGWIAVSPLIGGSMVLLLLLQLFFPQALSEGLTASSIESGNPVAQFTATVKTALTALLQTDHLTTLRFWVFLYLVLCVGSHMAPSGSDYRGTGRSLLMILAGISLLLILFSIIGVDPGHFQSTAISFLAPLFALFTITTLLCLIATMALLALLGPIPKKFEIRRGRP